MDAMTAKQLNQLIYQNEEQMAQLREGIDQLENLIVATQFWRSSFFTDERMLADFPLVDEPRFVAF